MLNKKNKGTFSLFKGFVKLPLLFVAVICFGFMQYYNNIVFISASSFVIFLPFRTFKNSSLNRRIIVVFALITITISSIYFIRKKYPSPPKVKIPSSWIVSNPVSKVFLVHSIREEKKSLNDPWESSIPDEFFNDKAIEQLLFGMKQEGLNFYTEGESDGIVTSDAVVIIKPDFQWDFRLGTNTDRIKGLIWAILNHPEKFTGEILICDNTQYEGKGIGENTNNSNDPQQSIIDVVAAFKLKGYKVDLVDWTKLNEIPVKEFDEGDNRNGYIFDDSVKLSYPKFISPFGSKISLKKGVWEDQILNYNRSKLKIINFPVLKAHGMMGTSDAFKGWLGVVSMADFESRYGNYNDMHYNYFFSDYALPARSMAQIFPDLNIIDATWIAYRDNYNNWYGNRVNAGIMLASTDPVAVSWYSAKYVLTPIAYTPKQTNPDGKDAYAVIFNNFITFVKNNTKYICTNDSLKISVFAYQFYK